MPRGKKDKMDYGKFYAKIVEWCEDRRCYLGLCPDLGIETHSYNEQQAFRDLSELIKDKIKLHEIDDTPPPQKRFHAARTFMYIN